MLKKLLLFLFLLGSLMDLRAQKKKMRYYLLPQVGLISGQQSNTCQLQLSGGIRHKYWQFGLGMGIDQYVMKSVPVFTDIRYAFGKRQSFFAYTNLGVNIHKGTEAQKDALWGGWRWGNGNFQNGWYTDWGIGYQPPLWKKHALIFSLGYSIKTIRETYQDRWFTIIRPPGPASGTIPVHHYNYQLNRMVVKMGISL